MSYTLKKRLRLRVLLLCEARSGEGLSLPTTRRQEVRVMIDGHHLLCFLRFLTHNNSLWCLTYFRELLPHLAFVPCQILYATYSSTLVPSGGFM